MSNFIHSTAILEGDIQLGNGNYIGPFCHLQGPLYIGDGNRFESYVSIGKPPQDDRFSHIDLELFESGISPLTNDYAKIIIGNNNVFREFVTIHKPEMTLTSIGNSCYLMTQSHISHDSILHDNVKIANSTHLGGFSRILSNTYLGLNVSVLQFSTIGSNAMVGMGSVVNKNIPPYTTFAGSPAKYIKINAIKVDEFQVKDIPESYPFCEKNEMSSILKEEYSEYEKNIFLSKELHSRFKSLT